MIAKESIPFLLATGAPSSVFLYLGLSSGGPVLTGLGSLLFVLTAFIAFFFQGPGPHPP